MSDKEKLRIVDKNNNIKEYDILTAFYWTKTDKNYVVYTDNTYDENNELNVFASIFYPDNRFKFDIINTDEEWEKIELVLKRSVDSGGDIIERKYS